MANDPQTSERIERRLLRRGLAPRWRQEPPSEFSGLADDSRRVRPGELFCAVPGTRVDGHDYVAEAAAAGATAAVVERRVEVPIPQLVVRDGRAAVAHLASLFHGDPGEALELVGVTGTNGKSTTVWLSRWLLAELGAAAAVGTLGVVRPDGEREPGTLTTPGPIELARGLARLRDLGAERVAMEVSSHALDQRRVESLRFRTVVFTSFSREHLEYHAGLEEYRAAKLRLLDRLAPRGTCVVNADEPAWRDVGSDGARRLRYGLAGAADGAHPEVRARDVELRPDRSRWHLIAPDGSARVELPLPGRFNVQNALAAASVALDAGLDPTRVAERLGRVPPVPGRMEVLRRRPTLVVRDYAHTPDAYERVLSSLREAVRGRLIVVFGCGGERDPGKRPLMGGIATRLADLAIVTTDNPRSEDPAAIAAQVVEGSDPERYETVLDRREAIARALELAGEADAVLLLGKGHETYQVFAEGREPFDEAAIVEELLSAGRSA